MDTDILIASMRAKKLGSRHDKPTEINKTILHYRKEDINVSIDMKSLINRLTDKDKFPTLEELRGRVLRGVDFIYQEHSYENGIISHNCCFDKYKDDIKSLIMILLNQDYIYAHRSVIKTMRR